MSAAADILDSLLEEMTEALDLADAEPGSEKDPFRDYLMETLTDAKSRWERAKMAGEKP